MTPSMTCAKSLLVRTAWLDIPTALMGILLSRKIAVRDFSAISVQSKQIVFLCIQVGLCMDHITVLCDILSLATVLAVVVLW